nr:type IV secretory system conjugative DNA transfer family protein [Campylobacter corcagiensis]
MKLCHNFRKFKLKGEKMRTIGFLAEKSCPNKVEKTINLAPNYTHAMIIGATGAGKTSSAIMPILEDRISKNHGILMFDYKGEEHKKVKFLAKKFNRLEDVVMINLPWGKSINIINECNTETFVKLLEDKCFTSNGNEFWSKFASGYLKSVLDVSNSKERLIKTLTEQGLDLFTKPEINFKMITNILSSAENFKDFCLQIKEFKDAINFCDFKKYANDLPTDEAGVNFLVSINNPLKEFLKISDTFLEQNRSFYDEKLKYDDSLYVFKKNLPAMLSVINRYANNDFINQLDEKTIFEMLNEGKIVVINTTNFNDTILSVLLGGVLENSAKRKAFKELNPISLFIDEAQKVLSPDMDLHTDVLREAKVEVILSFQNEHLLINKIGKDEYFALKQNLVSKFIFKSEIQSYYEDAKDFETFECFDGNDVFMAKPIFIGDDELNLVEYEYQRLNKVMKNFAAHINSSDKFLVYNHALFEKDSKFYLFCLKNKTIIDEVDFISWADYMRIKRSLKTGFGFMKS